MKPLERKTAALEALGYSEKESRFLRLVALYSGYFTKRHFLAYWQSGAEAALTTLLAKLVSNKHVESSAFRKSARVYHLFAPRFYEAVGQFTIGTTRRHSLDYVRTRLVVLDFVLAHPDLSFLDTEEEKLLFFEQQFGIPRTLLPSRCFRSLKKKESIRRYFADQFPIFQTAEAHRPSVSFTFVDQGSQTFQPFRTFLRAYAELLRALPSFELLFLSPTARLFQTAEADFTHAFLPTQESVSVPELFRYFRTRKKWEDNERVPSAEVLFLSDAMARYDEARFGSLYGSWSLGKSSEAEIRHEVLERALETQRLFRGEIWGASLCVFGDPPIEPSESAGAQGPQGLLKFSGIDPPGDPEEEDLSVPGEVGA